MRAVALAAVVSLMLGGPALADGPVATAPAAGPAAPQPTAPPPPLAPPSAVSSDGPRVAMGPCGPENVKPDGTLETKPHGEMVAGVGTGGYRELGGSVCQPIGQTGMVAMSVDDIQGSGYRRR